MPSVTSLLRLGETRERGPSPSFTKAHLILAFLEVGDAGTIGRQALAREIGVGEGAIRTILKKLKGDGYAGANASGCYLTSAGKMVHSRLREKITKVITVDGSQLTVGGRQVAVSVRGGAARVRGGIEQRDSAIKVGASGATTYVIRGTKFTIPGGSSNCEKDYPSPVWSRLRKEFRLRDGEALIISGSSEEMKARLGALSAALTLL